MNTIKGLEHLAIIMDGNGRWASVRGLNRSVGHEHGYQIFKKIVAYLVKLNIPEVSFFALSSENFKRPSDELNFLLELFILGVQNDLSLLNQEQVCVKIVGDFNLLNQAVLNAIDVLHRNNELLPSYKMQLNICFAYSGQWHIEQAFKDTLALGKDASLARFKTNLMSPFLQPMDLIIRTGGEIRISNFALWQLAYAELLFIDDYWPDFDEKKLDDCIKIFCNRKRRFGNLNYE